jgi:2'-5' RNA ligase
VAARRWLQVVASFPELTWRVLDFLLIDSELTRGGPRHKVSRRFDLVGQ